MIFHWLGKSDFRFHSISVDLETAVNAGDANHLSQAVPKSELRPSATMVGTGSGN
jgi:hypothetical protein